jgi:glycosyltransferase involved in cell wall biosynthesis
VFVDDGSSDNTLLQLIALTARDKRIRVIEFSRNFGKEAAMTAGIDAARGEAVIPIDVDLQDPPSLIAQMVAAWEAGAEVVLARRIDRASDGVLKRQTASWFYRLHNRMSKTKIPENVGDFRLMDRIVVDALKKLPERQRFMKGLFAWVGFRTVALDYTRATRAAGATKFSGLALWNFALEGITSFSTLPLKIWTYLGAAGALSALAYAIFIIIRTIISGSSVAGYASLFVAVLFFGSVQLMSIGLLGEYIGRIYIETKQRPAYLVRKVHGQTVS